MAEQVEPKALHERVIRVLTEEVAPALAMDGTRIEVVNLQDGVQRVRLHGACGGCPGSVVAVLMGIEHELRRRVPEIEYLEAVP
jgi:Fe-S cluster biogenesis protein NfuA